MPWRVASKHTYCLATIFLNKYVLEVAGVVILSDSRFQYLIPAFTPRNQTREQ